MIARKSMAISTEEREMRSSSVVDLRRSQSSKVPLHLAYGDSCSSNTPCCVCTVCPDEECNAISIAQYCKRKHPTKTRTYTLCEVRRHCTVESAWLIAGCSVFDATEYLSQHPGGADAILRKAGGAIDCTEDILFHSLSGRKMWQKYLVGELVPCTARKGSFCAKPWWQLW